MIRRCDIDVNRSDDNVMSIEKRAQFDLCETTVEP